MKQLLLLLVGATLLVGCRSSYVITLNNRTQIRSASKPELRGGAYVYKDARGQEQFIQAGRVAEIAPESMMEKNKFKSATGK
jgi:hypothetical protein